MTTKTEVWAYECPCCYHAYEPDERPEDGRCTNCDDAPNLREKQSEFGAGIVVCLAKFSEHLWTDRERTMAELVGYGEGKVKGLSERAQRDLDFANDMLVKYPDDKARYGDPLAYAIDQAVSMWASGAGDHWFDLDRDKAPAEIIELADHVLRLRNGHFSEERFTAEDYYKIRQLWEAACIALDRKLGTVPNWGEW